MCCTSRPGWGQTHSPTGKKSDFTDVVLPHGRRTGGKASQLQVRAGRCREDRLLPSHPSALQQSPELGSGIPASLRSAQHHRVIVMLRKGDSSSKGRVAQT